ncbi:MAG: recombinase family protein [Okeania sp. SIO3I5]|uniref:recombinase family protein n=1 Tax=Okeania sp. SIO3I5 TaxID=2607805 RepID=UPI0013BBC71F|nr:recombinase family protein [Okeania sp. SIO3I5]NEQ41396.1 recombinase family protein [Okeania sp. SIO3I5]
MPSSSLWITGPTLSGKTTRLIEEFCIRGQQIQSPLNQIVPTVRPENLKSDIGDSQYTEPQILILAANAENRINLMDRISEATSEQYPYHSTTPLGFFEDEVILFWPLLIQALDLSGQFPLRLRPETEQELAGRFWRPQIEKLQQPGVSLERMIRRTLDLFQLAAFSCTPTEEIGMILQEGFNEVGTGSPSAPEDFYANIVELLQQWRDWCCQRGFLTYGIITELYWRYLLPNSTYQQHLIPRYPFVLADDVDEYPAIIYQLFDFLLDNGSAGVFTYNPDGSVRLGLGADPECLAELQKRCQIELLEAERNLAQEIGEPIVELVVKNYLNNSIYQLPTYFKSIETRSRASLLRETAEAIAKDINLGIVKPEEVAIIAPGLDAIARYSLISILNKNRIAVESLKEQRPLISYPMIRALLSILTLVYPGLGRLVDRDAVAEMLVVLSHRSIKKGEKEIDAQENLHKTNDIDPVRAGLLADHCFYPDITHPRLLPIETFSRWDRVGYRATRIYNQILEWIEKQRSQQEQRQVPNPIFLLDRAIQKFFISNYLSFAQLAALRELMETATHYWEVERRLQQNSQFQVTELMTDNPVEENSSSSTVEKFIQFLRRGVVSANPYPVRSIGNSPPTVTLATIFQYRASRKCHRWQFWLDIGSSLWLSGGSATLYGAPLFLQGQLGKSWTIEDTQKSDRERLRRILLDLLSRVGYSNSSSVNGSNEYRIYLCHSDLAVNGQEQTGPLLPLVYSSMSYTG